MTNEHTDTKPLPLMQPEYEKSLRLRDLPLSFYVCAPVLLLFAYGMMYLNSLSSLRGFGGIPFYAVSEHLHWPVFIALFCGPVGIAIICCIVIVTRAAHKKRGWPILLCGLGCIGVNFIVCAIFAIL